MYICTLNPLYAMSRFSNLQHKCCSWEFLVPCKTKLQNARHFSCFNIQLIQCTTLCSGHNNVVKGGLSVLNQWKLVLNGPSIAETVLSNNDYFSPGYRRFKNPPCCALSIVWPLMAKWLLSLTPISWPHNIKGQILFRIYTFGQFKINYIEKNYYFSTVFSTLEHLQIWSNKSFVNFKEKSIF